MGKFICFWSHEKVEKNGFLFSTATNTSDPFGSRYPMYPWVLHVPLSTPFIYPWVLNTWDPWSPRLPRYPMYPWVLHLPFGTPFTLGYPILGIPWNPRLCRDAVPYNIRLQTPTNSHQFMLSLKRDTFRNGGARNRVTTGSRCIQSSTTTVYPLTMPLEKSLAR